MRKVLKFIREAFWTVEAVADLVVGYILAGLAYLLIKLRFYDAADKLATMALRMVVNIAVIGWEELDYDVRKAEDDTRDIYKEAFDYLGYDF